MHTSLFDAGIRTGFSPLRSPSRTAECQLQVRTIADVDERFCQAWRDLEKDSLSGNPFCSPEYVLPAIHHLSEIAQPYFLTVESQREMLWLGVFESVSGSRRLPVPHLRAWQTPHTYLDAPLIRRGHAQRACEVFWDFLSRGRHDWHAVEFPRSPDSDPVTQTLDETAQSAAISCLRGTYWERASLITSECQPETLLARTTIKRMKSLRRGWRELEKLGEVQFEFQRDPQRISECAEEFMRLESLGWKAERGTALASQIEHQKFFREMISRFNLQQSVMFSRLLVNGEAVASVAHLLAGETAYAFKLGWNPACERGCPGFQLKMQTAMNAGLQLPEVRMIDSCSSPGSFIERVWPHRRGFCHRMYLTSPVGSLAAAMVSGLRWFRNNAMTVSRHLLQQDGECKLL